KRSHVADDHRCLRHESLGDTSDRETFFAEILIPKMGEYFSNIRSFKFNRSSLFADINCAVMILVIQQQRCELLLNFLESYNKPPIRSQTQGMDFTSTRYCLRLDLAWLPRHIHTQRFCDCN